MGRAAAARAARQPLAALMAVLRAHIAEKLYPGVGDAPPYPALRDLESAVAAGEFVALVGPSGCGKTTFLNIVAGLDRDFDGEVVLQPSENGRTPRIGYVFQNPRLLPWRTVRENLMLVLRRGQDPEAVDRLLRAVELYGARNVYPGRLSGGMSRRAAIARAFVIDPDLLLMDEPFVSLDADGAARLRELLLALWRARPTTVLFVTHDLREAVFLADRLLLLSPAPGRVLADLPIPLPRERRGDGAASDDLCREIGARHRQLIEEAGFARERRSL
jgi:ABC-type nitrate/sulfonate/bicarbonate transport system ATPase subunit